MYRYYLTLSVIISLLLIACNRDDNALLSVIADFEAEILLGENQAIVTVTNSSQNATSYQWTASNGTVENTTVGNHWKSDRWASWIFSLHR